MKKELIKKMELMISDEIDGKSNEKTVIDKNLSITEDGLMEIEKHLNNKEKLSFNMFFSLNFSSVRSLLTDGKNSNIEFNNELTNGFTNFNGYVWNYDLKNNDPWVASYSDLLYSMMNHKFDVIKSKEIL